MGRMKLSGVVTTVDALRERVAAWRREDARIGLVPTMGALHGGHLALVRATGKRCNKTIVSIFVNPAQFAPHEDFDRYPRTLEADREKLADSADLVFAPGTTEMYPDGFATKVEVAGPALGLESDFRPHFFAGVATVVAKLLLAAMPDLAMFGEKDYQQLLVIRQLARDLALPVEIAGGAIVREDDGLALSSRNAYLDPRERAVAGRLNLVLKDAVARLRTGDAPHAVERTAAAALLGAGFDSVDYVAVRDAASLAAIMQPTGANRVLAAVRIGKTRLIDNIAT